jgi:predicted transcriptional regulator
LHELTDLQVRVLDEIWMRGEATVAEVHQAIEADTRLARKTVGTIMMRLEQYGVLTHREDGREFVYEARVTRAQVRRAAVRRTLTTLFKGDVASLMAHALEEREIEPREIVALQRLLEEASE